MTKKKENKKDTGISDRKCGHNDPVCDHYPVSGIKYIGNFIKRWNRCLKRRDLSVTEKVYMEKLYDCASER